MVLLLVLLSVLLLVLLNVNGFKTSSNSRSNVKIFLQQQEKIQQQDEKYFLNTR